MSRFFFSSLVSRIVISMLTVCFASLTTTAYARDKLSDASIRFNQVGYLPTAGKIAVIKSGPEKSFSIIDADTQESVYQGELGKPKVWPHSKESVQKLDFSALATEGRYQIKVGAAVSPVFNIGENVLDDVHTASIKSFYLNRASIDLEERYAGRFARKAGHLDTKVQVHKSAATEARPENTVLSAPKGWYDAGDYGKYSVNSGISTYTLLLALQQFSDIYSELALNIPESDDQIPDLFNEIKWNLDWFAAMQDTDGGVYHKLTALGFSSMEASPAKENKRRWFIGKSVTASLNYAAVFAHASRVLANYESEFPGLSAQYLSNAQKAYSWALANPTAIYEQPKDVSTGAYGDRKVTDEFAWAAAELFLATNNTQYWQHFEKLDIDPTNGLSWAEVAPLPYISLLEFGRESLNEEQLKWVEDKLLAAAKQELDLYEGSAYNVAMDTSDFVWGSNSVALNNGLIAYQAFKLTGDDRYLSVTSASLNYVLGTNATGYSFVTGFGHHSPRNIHHRPSTSDKISDPIPGFIAGGPHSGRQDKCHYEGRQPATTYADTVCSYSTNEIAINWNSPLVYVLGAMISTQASD